MGKKRGLWEYDLQPGVYGGAGDASYTANTLAWVDSAALTVTALKLSNKGKLTVDLDLDAYYTAHVRYLQERDEVVLDNGGGGGRQRRRRQ